MKEFFSAFANHYGFVWFIIGALVAGGWIIYVDADNG